MGKFKECIYTKEKRLQQCKALVKLIGAAPRPELDVLLMSVSL